MKKYICCFVLIFANITLAMEAEKKMFPYTIIDLSHEINESIPLWPGSPAFKMDVRHDYPDSGCRVVSYSFIAGTGTHMDAPSHFAQGGKSVHQLPLSTLIVPLCLIDVRKHVASNPDYTVQPEDILDWEKKYGTIASSSVVVMHSGWAQRWPNMQQYVNQDAQGIKHFPAFSLTAAQLLVERGVVGIGTDTFSIDPGNTKDFPVHNSLLAKGVYFLENLANLDQVPASGAFICALPLPVANGPEIPVRVVAFIKQ